MRDFEILAERYPREFVEQTGGNLAAMARELFVEKTATDVVCLEGLKVHCRILVDDLAGPDPSPVLRLAVEVALFCYLEHWVLTEDFSRRPPNQENRDQARRREAAFNRYVKSLRFVEAVRRTPRIGRSPARVLDVTPFPLEGSNDFDAVS